MKSSEIDFKIINILSPIDDPVDGYTTIELTKMIYGEEWNMMTNTESAKACNRVSRRMGAIRHEIYDNIYKELKERSEDPGYPKKGNLDDMFTGGEPRKPDPLGSSIDAEDLKPTFLPFALPVGNSNTHVTWKYFNAALHPHVNNVIENHFNKSAGLEFRAKLLSKVYEK